MPNSTTRPQNPISLREEAIGKLHKKADSNVKSLLKLEHLKNLAVLASSEVSIPSLGAFYGQCFASAKEAMCIPPDPLVTCEICEIVLHPGFNCTVRIEKRRTKGKNRRNKFANVTQNNVAYKCHYCLHQNLKNGTFKGHVKVICPPKETSMKESKHGQIPSHESGKSEKGIMNKDEAIETNMFASKAAAIDIPTIHCPATLRITSLRTALEGSKRKRYRLGSNKRRRYRLGSNKASELASTSAKKDAEKATSTSSKRRRKSWTSLKEIAQSSEHNSRIAKLSIPFIF